MFIKKSDFLWMKENPEIFAKYLHDYFDFTKKGLTHWKIIINNSTSHLVQVSLRKDNKSKDWFSINNSVSGKNASVHRYQNHPDKAWGNDVYYKQLDVLWDDCPDNFLNTFFKIMKRDAILNELLYVEV